MMRARFVRHALVLAALLSELIPAPALADCAIPSGREGEIVYNADFAVLQYCNGTDWIGMGGASAGPGGLTDGNKGDVTVSGSGATWTINSGAVQYGKIQNVGASSLLGRYTGTSGSVQEITLGSGLSLNGTTGVLTATGTATTAADATGAIQYNGGSGTFAGDAANFYWDATNKRLGIGTNTPGNPLYVKYAGSGRGVVIEETTASPAIEFRDGSAPQNKWAVGSGVDAATDGKFFIYDARQTTPRLIIDTVGNVGIGTTAPANRLEVTEATANTRAGRFNANVTSNPADGYGILSLNSLDTTASSKTALVFAANDDGGSSRHAAAIMMGKDGNWAGGVGPYTGYLSFWTRSASPNDEVERMRITSDGNVGIATTAPTVGSLLEIASGGYLQTDKSFAGTPTTTDCDAAVELGRLTFDTANKRLYYCTGAAGWVYDSMGTSGGTATAAGSTGQVQFNASNALAADSKLFWDNTNKRLGIGTATPGFPLEVAGVAKIDGGSNSNWAGLNVGGSTSINAAGTIYSYDRICTGNSSGSCNSTGGVVISGNGGTAAGSVFINGSGTSTFTNGLDIGGEVVSTSVNAFRMVYGNYGSFLRNDGNATYFLLTASGDQYGTFNALRPFSFNNATGTVTMSNGVSIGSGLAMNNSKITGLATPTATTDAATKAYVDSAVAGGGDNLGNHTATQALAMGAYAITSSAGTIIDAGGSWHRSYNSTGWYNGTYGGGIYMTDASYVRIYNAKAFLVNSSVASVPAITGNANGSGTYGVVGTSDTTYGIRGQSTVATSGGVLGYTANGTYYGILGYDNAYSLYGNGALYSGGTATFGGAVTAPAFSGSGASLTSLNGSNISSGTVAPARLGSGSPSSGNFLRGDGTWAAPASGGITSEVNPTNSASGGEGSHIASASCPAGYFLAGCTGTCTVDPATQSASVSCSASHGNSCSVSVTLICLR